MKLLDGGRQRWEHENRELTIQLPALSPTQVQIDGPVRGELRAFRDEVLARLDSATFVDVRSPAEYQGEVLAPPHLPQEQAQVPGHIPGAHNVPWSKGVPIERQEAAQRRPATE